MENQDLRKRHNNVWFGILLLIVGLGLLLQHVSTPIPWWLFSWKTFLILLGVFIGIRQQFRGGTWFAMILIGGAFLLNDIYPSLMLHEYIWPFVIITLGVWLIIRPKSAGKVWDGTSPRRFRRWEDQGPQINSPAGDFGSGEDFIDATSVFGGVRKVILSKNFKGGDVTSFMGGTELDLTQADIQGRVVLDVTSVLGGTKIIIPSNWDLKSELTTVLGGIEDKRMVTSTGIDPNKILVLKGTCFLGGIEIRSY